QEYCTWQGPDCNDFVNDILRMVAEQSPDPLVGYGRHIICHCIQCQVARKEIDRIVQEANSEPTIQSQDEGDFETRAQRLAHELLATGGAGDWLALFRKYGFAPTKQAQDEQP